MTSIHVRLSMYESLQKPDTPIEFLKQVVEIVCRWHKVDYNQVFERCRKRDVVDCRKISVWIMVRLCPNLKSNDVGAFFRADRTNMYHYINTVNDWRETNTDYAQKVEDIFQFVKQKFV